MKVQRSATDVQLQKGHNSNSYDSTNCIRFEGIISAIQGTPLSLLKAKITQT